MLYWYFLPNLRPYGISLDWCNLPLTACQSQAYDGAAREEEGSSDTHLKGVSCCSIINELVLQLEQPSV